MAAFGLEVAYHRTEATEATLRTILQSRPLSFTFKNLRSIYI